MPSALPLFRAAPWSAAVLALLGMTGCAPLPEVPGHAATVTAPPPALVPVDDILAQADSLQAGATAGSEVGSRAAALRARAAAIRRD